MGASWAVTALRTLILAVPPEGEGAKASVAFRDYSLPADELRARAPEIFLIQVPGNHASDPSFCPPVPCVLSLIFTPPRPDILMYSS
jgi:hypothetical protein